MLLPCIRCGGSGVLENFPLTQIFPQSHPAMQRLVWYIFGRCPSYILPGSEGEGYSFLVMKIREFQAQGMTLEEATDAACQYCIEHDILKKFLLKNRSEVRNVLLTEYNAKHQRKLDRRDARAEGRSEERSKAIERLLRKGKSPEEIHELLDYPIEEILRVEREARSTIK
jgi:hypothetical protein